MRGISALLSFLLLLSVLVVASPYLHPDEMELISVLPDRGVRFPDTFIFCDTPETLLSTHKGEFLCSWRVSKESLAQLYLYYYNSSRETLYLRVSFKAGNGLRLLGYVRAGRGDLLRLGDEIAQRQLVSFLRGDEFSSIRYSELTCSLSLKPGELAIGYLLFQSSSMVQGATYLADRPDTDSSGDEKLKLGELSCQPSGYPEVSPLSWAEAYHQRGVGWLSSIFQFCRLSDVVELYLGDVSPEILAPFKDSDSPIHLKGAYGIPHLFHLVGDGESYEVLVNPRGGKVMLSAALKLDGRWYLLSSERAFRAYQERRLMSLDGVKELYLLSLPEGASSYPVKIIIRRVK